MPDADAPLFGTCPICQRKYRLRSDGTVRGHRDRSDRTQVCVGEYQAPADTPTTNPWRRVTSPAGKGRPMPDAESDARCLCDGAAYFTAEQNAARYPFLRHSECPVHSKFLLHARFLPPGGSDA